MAVDFQKNVLTPNLVDGKFNLVEYYLNKYNIEITDMKQPLLLVANRRKTDS